MGELTKKETEVLKQVYNSALEYRCINKSQIAQNLGITVNTLNCHLAWIYQKLRVQDITSAIILWQQMPQSEPAEEKEAQLSLF